MSKCRFTVSVVDGRIVVMDTYNDDDVLFDYVFDGKLLLECEGIVKVLNTLNYSREWCVNDYTQSLKENSKCIEDLRVEIRELKTELKGFEVKREVYDREMFMVIPNVGVENVLTGEVYSTFRGLCKVCNDLCFKNDLLVESFDELLYKNNEE